MMIVKSNRQYAKIRTMSELRMARERLNWQIKASEQTIADRYDNLVSVFSISHLSAIVVSKLENIRAWVSTIYDGYQLAMSIFRRKGNSNDYAEDNVADRATTDTSTSESATVGSATVGSTTTVNVCPQCGHSCNRESVR